jgi:isochorismate hydrolase
MLIKKGRSQLLIIDVQERLATAMPEKDDIIQTCSLLLKAAVEMRVPVSVSEQYPRGLGHMVAHLQALSEPASHFEKLEFSCLQNPRLKQRLSAGNRQQLIIAGLEAHVCVLQTTLDALGAGFEAFVVADAIGSRKASSKTLGLERMARAGAEIVTAEMVVFEWLGSSAAPEFKALSALVR